MGAPRQKIHPSHLLRGEALERRTARDGTTQSFERPFLSIWRPSWRYYLLSLCLLRSFTCVLVQHLRRHCGLAGIPQNNVTWHIIMVRKCMVSCVWECRDVMSRYCLLCMHTSPNRGKRVRRNWACYPWLEPWYKHCLRLWEELLVRGSTFS